MVHSEEEALGTRLTIDSRTCLLSNEHDPSKVGLGGLAGCLAGGPAEGMAGLQVGVCARLPAWLNLVQYPCPAACNT